MSTQRTSLNESKVVLTTQFRSHSCFTIESAERHRLATSFAPSILSPNSKSSAVSAFAFTAASTSVATAAVSVLHRSYPRIHPPSSSSEKTCSFLKFFSYSSISSWNAASSSITFSACASCIGFTSFFTCGVTFFATSYISFASTNFLSIGSVFPSPLAAMYCSVSARRSSSNSMSLLDSRIVRSADIVRKSAVSSPSPISAFNAP
jgi:hypothetical protein